MKNYPSKLLLFGEHAVIKGADALALPYGYFSGQWRRAEPGKAPELQSQLPEWLAYLQNLDQSGHLLSRLDLDAFGRDLAEGYYFDSNIPTGYGLGSSGALCAALYDKYHTGEQYWKEKGGYPFLRAQLAQLENFFHGNSSGIDPLVSFINHPLRLGNGGLIESVKIPEASADSPVLFLLDTGIRRQTGPLVQWFLSQCQNPDYARAVEEQLLPANNAAIDAFLKGQWNALFHFYNAISRFELDYFQAMILPQHKTLWTDALYSGDCLFKLCGAGGGGFLLGITRNWESCERLLAAYTILRVY